MGNKFINLRVISGVAIIGHIEAVTPRFLDNSETTFFK